MKTHINGQVKLKWI